MRISFGIDKIFQLDWSKDWAVLAEECVKLQAAHSMLTQRMAFIVWVNGSGSMRCLSIG